jgi:hypothetical protein
MVRRAHPPKGFFRANLLPWHRLESLGHQFKELSRSEPL